MAPRVILHSDFNNFYASVECRRRPEIRNRPVAVAGDPELRHGIVLAKNMLAKVTGVATGEPIWKARQKCPELILVPPDFTLYRTVSQEARQIYQDYSHRVEPFGLDEAWLDVSGSEGMPGGRRIAYEIRERIRRELGITVSVGVSDNKVFAKLGSDIREPDAVTVITKTNFRQTVWPLSTRALLYVGRATQRKLETCGIRTIGEIARAQPDFLQTILGKWGRVLWSYANGLDASPVRRIGEKDLPKSVGNSMTTSRDLVCDADVWAVFQVLCESVAARLREQNLKGTVLQIHVRDCNLCSFERQATLPYPTFLAGEMVRKAMEIFGANYPWGRSIRSLGVRMTGLTHATQPYQLCMFNDEAQRIRAEQLEETVDTLRKRFGHHCIGRATLLCENGRFNINPKADHVIYPSCST